METKRVSGEAYVRNEAQEDRSRSPCETCQRTSCGRGSPPGCLAWRVRWLARWEATRKMYLHPEKKNEPAEAPREVPLLDHEEG